MDERVMYLIEERLALYEHNAEERLELISTAIGVGGEAFGKHLMADWASEIALEIRKSLSSQFIPEAVVSMAIRKLATMAHGGEVTPATGRSKEFVFDDDGSVRFLETEDPRFCEEGIST